MGNAIMGGTSIIPIGSSGTYYLPCGPPGRTSFNALPVVCDKFCFLLVSADLTAFGGSVAAPVYVPCYIPEEEPPFAAGGGGKK